MQTDLQEIITDLEQKGLKRELRTLQGAQGPRVIFDGREVLNFCSNNYLGLANDDRLIQAAIASMKKEGFGAGASRLVCGNQGAHQALEHKLAEFKGTASCLLFSSGYMANIGIISSLFSREDIIFGDKLNHASIIDGVLLSHAAYKRYPHNDMAALEKLIQGATGYAKRAIITDSVFSMDGDTAPLKEIVALAQKYDCTVMIDEAHALGVLGEKGKGLAHHLGVENKIAVQMGTLSKAAGSYGAYCCGSKELIAFLINKARSFIYTTGLPASVAAASMRAIEIIEEDDTLRKRLWENTRFVWQGLKKMGFNTLNTQTPIVPILVMDPAMTVKFSNRLLDEGIWISAIRPPTVPANTSRLRLTIMATHEKQDLVKLLEKLQLVGKELCLI